MTYDVKMTSTINDIIIDHLSLKDTLVHLDNHLSLNWKFESLQDINYVTGNSVLTPRKLYLNLCFFLVCIYDTI